MDNEVLKKIIEIKNEGPLYWEPGTIKGFFLSKPGVGRNSSSHAAPGHRSSTVLIPAFPMHSTSFSLGPLQTQSDIIMRQERYHF